MKILIDYECKTHGIFEGWADSKESKEKPCPCCDAPAARKFTSMRFKLEGLSGHFPTTASKWADFHEKEGKKESQD